jgi:aquaporin Z
MRRYLAEMIGTFALVFCGTGAIVINQQTGGVIGHAGIAATFGLIVTAMIYTFGDISGAHLNPAVTIAFSAAKLFKWKDVPAYISGQLAGAFLASLLLKLLFPSNATLGATLPSGSDMQSCIVEVVLYLLLMFVIQFNYKG